MVTAVSRNKSVRTLKMGRNMVNIKSKHVHHVVEAVVQMIQVRPRDGLPYDEVVATAAIHDWGGGGRRHRGCQW